MKLLERAISLVAPFECLACGTEGNLVCQACLSGIVITKRPTCYRCNRLSDGGRTCSSCRSSSQLAGVIVASHYAGLVKELIRRLKFAQARAAARSAGSLLAPLLARRSFDVVVAVPTAASRYRRRGYNQAELIGRTVAGELALPYRPGLIRLGNARQVGANRLSRIQQIHGSLVAKHSFAGQRVLLVDDVLTTGATMAECARVLKQAGAKSVWGAVVAKH